MVVKVEVTDAWIEVVAGERGGVATLEIDVGGRIHRMGEEWNVGTQG